MIYFKKCLINPQKPEKSISAPISGNGARSILNAIELSIRLHRPEILINIESAGETILDGARKSYDYWPLKNLVAIVSVVVKLHLNFLLSTISMTMVASIGKLIEVLEASIVRLSIIPASMKFRFCAGIVI